MLRYNITYKVEVRKENNMNENTKTNIKKTFKPQDERFDDFDKLCYSLKNQYTLGFKKSCQMLKVSRSWMNSYIRPFVPAIYLSTGIGNRPMPNYHKIAFAKLGIKTPPKDQIFFDKQEFTDYVFNHIVSCKKRAKRLLKIMFMSEEQKKAYVLDFEQKILEEELAEKAFMNGTITATELRQAHRDRAECWKAYVPENVLNELQIVENTKRTDAPFVDVDLPDAPISEWTAVHDVLDYGDVTETIYRHFFEEGKIRLELSFPSPKTEKTAKKIYYVSDPDEVAIMQINDEFANFIDNLGINQDATDSLIANNFFTVSESSWKSFNDKHKII